MKDAISSDSSVCSDKENDISVVDTRPGAKRASESQSGSKKRNKGAETAQDVTTDTDARAAAGSSSDTTPEDCELKFYDGITIDECVVGSSDNIVKKGKAETTRLVSISGAKVMNIPQKLLRRIGSRLNVGKARSLSKGPLCEAIVAKKEAMQTHKVVGAKGSRSAAAAAAGKEPSNDINYYRFVNAMADETAKPLLAGISRKLSAVDLTNKIKPAEDFIKALVSVCNDSDEDSVNLIRYLPDGFEDTTEVEECVDADPAVFQGPITHKQAKAAFGKLRTLLVQLLENFDASGTNDDGPIPFREFCKNRMNVAHLHAFRKAPQGHPGSGCSEIACCMCHY